MTIHNGLKTVFREYFARLPTRRPTSDKSERREKRWQARPAQATVRGYQLHSSKKAATMIIATTTQAHPSRSSPKNGQHLQMTHNAATATRKLTMRNLPESTDKQSHAVYAQTCPPVPYSLERPSYVHQYGHGNINGPSGNITWERRF